VPISDRDWLLARIETEARAYVNADLMLKEMRWGYVLGLLDVGVHFEYWSARAAAGASELIRNRYAVHRVRKLLTR
jgi:hypothetical protein